jgi:hypothetical protein
MRSSDIMAPARSPHAASRAFRRRFTLLVLAGQQTAGEREVRHQAHAQTLARRDDLPFD